MNLWSRKSVMVDSHHSHDNDALTEVEKLESKADTDIQDALKSKRLLFSEPWIRCNQCCYWVEQNMVQVAVLLGLSWACYELCAYFGALVFLGELAWIYSQATEKTSNS